MRFLTVAVFILLAGAAFAGDGPKQGYVHDFAGVLSDAQETALEAELTATFAARGQEIRVIIVEKKADYFEGGVHYGFLDPITNEYEPTRKAGGKLNDRVSLVVQLKERKVLYALANGFGADANAAAHGLVSEKIVPFFAKGDLAGGVMAGARAAIQTFEMK